MKFFKIAVFFIGLSTFAQGKVGSVDIDYIISRMPEMTNVKEELQSYGAKMDVDLNKKVEEYKALIEQYKEEEITLTLAQKKQKQDQMMELEADIQKFQTNGAKLMEIKQQELLRPLYDKIGEALEKVAQANGYTQVLQSTSDIVYLDPDYDLTNSILLEMGIPLNEEKEGE